MSLIIIWPSETVHMGYFEFLIKAWRIIEYRLVKFMIHLHRHGHEQYSLKIQISGIYSSHKLLLFFIHFCSFCTNILLEIEKNSFERINFKW